MANSRKKIITVIGATGTGKSKLAVDLALALNGEVINADAMQVYKGLDIITNKITTHDMRGVPHHLLGFREPNEPYVVGHFVNDTVRLIDEIHARGRLPIVVGGTTYWLQHLLFSNRLISDVSSTDETPKSIAKPPSSLLSSKLDNLPPELMQLYAALPEQPASATEDAEGAARLYILLQALDEEMAARWHWKDTRKVLRSLEIIKETGQLASEVIKEQDGIASEARFQTLLLWTHTPRCALDPRLDKRVDVMIKEGLLTELRTLETIARTSLADNHAVDTTSGIFQSIGYKEFQQYLAQSPPDAKTFHEASETMKLATRKYAVYQMKWIQKKLLPAVLRASGSAHPYVLDTSEPEDWEGISEAAVSLGHAFVLDEPLPDAANVCPLAEELFPLDQGLSKPSDALLKQRKRTCDVCTVEVTQPVQIEESVWSKHVNSRQHQGRVKWLRLQESGVIPPGPRKRPPKEQLKGTS